MSNDLYKDAGVNLDAGDAISAYAARIVQESWQNTSSILVTDLSQGDFRGPRPFDLVSLPADVSLFVGADGVGTKTSLEDACLSEKFAGYDLAAMTGGDQTRYGVMPVALVTVLDTATLGEVGSDLFLRHQAIFDGLGAAARSQNVALLGGETAELGACVGSPNLNAELKFNLAGFMLGVYHPDYAITGHAVKPGDVVVALREKGFRSNGISAVRKAFAYQFTDAWWEEAPAELLRQAAEPSVLYDAFLVQANGWHGRDEQIPVSGIAHITGGGILSKFKGILKASGCSARLDNLWDPPEIMLRCAEWTASGRGTEVTDREFYSTWNGGQGVLAVLDEANVSAFIKRAKLFGIEARVCGEMYETPSGGKQSLSISSKISDKLLIQHIG